MTHDEKMEVSSRLKNFLTERGINYNSFARMIGTNSMTVGRQLNGVNPLSIETIVETLRNFPSMSAYWLLFGEGDTLIEVKGERPALEEKEVGLAACNAQLLRELSEQRVMLQRAQGQITQLLEIVSRQQSMSNP